MEEFILMVVRYKYKWHFTNKRSSEIINSARNMSNIGTISSGNIAIGTATAPINGVLTIPSGGSAIMLKVLSSRLGLSA